jgi:hypothetical protein
VRLDGVVATTAASIIYAIVLRPVVELPGPWWVASDIGLHYLAPVMTLAGWIAFGPRRRIELGTVARAMVWPALWCSWTLGHGAVTGWYPYPFIDVPVLGYPRALANAAVVIILLLACCAGAWVADRRLAAWSQERGRRAVASAART